MNIPTPPVLTANDVYDVKANPGFEYLFALKGTFDGATVTLSTRDDTVQDDQLFNTVADGSFTAETEQLFLAPSQILRLTVSAAGASTSIRVLMLPRKP